jgi:hypothetical protein
LLVVAMIATCIGSFYLYKRLRRNAQYKKGPSIEKK